MFNVFYGFMFQMQIVFRFNFSNTKLAASHNQLTKGSNCINKTKPLISSLNVSS